MDERGQKIDFDRFLSLDARRRDILQNVEALRNERNSVSREIGELKKRRRMPRRSSKRWVGCRQK